MNSDIAEYRALLAAEESVATLDKAMSLARGIVAGSKRGQRNGRTQSPQASSPKAPHQRHQSGSPNMRRIEEAAEILSTLPSMAQLAEMPDERYSFLMDALLVVFHQSYFVLLPKAKNRRQLLLSAFDSFAEALPNYRDRFQVTGLIEIERGRPELAEEAFRAALAATPSDEHDFLTPLQMLWSFLMERQDLSGAFACLQDVAPRVTRIDFDEFQGLYAATFQEAQLR